MPKHPQDHFEDGELVSCLSGQFWRKLGWIAAKQLARCPEHLREDLLRELYDCTLSSTDYIDKLKFLIEQKETKKEPAPEPTKPRLLVILAYRSLIEVCLTMRNLGYVPVPRLTNGWVLADCDERLHGLKDVDFYIHPSFSKAANPEYKAAMETVLMLQTLGHATVLSEIPPKKP